MLTIRAIYAKYGFSAAAPAGLHFTPAFANIKSTHPWHEITLNVGLGTFLPVKTSNITDHHMHSESYTISPHTATSLNKSKLDHKLLAIGTTTTRALESSLDESGQITPKVGETKIFSTRLQVPASRALNQLPSPRVDSLA
jgi:S-adenosylmethionine:tRNA ribosyltransferase-isomerase